MREGGRIINLSTSIIGAWLPAHDGYVATKAAIEAMTHTVTKELGPRDVAQVVSFLAGPDGGWVNGQVIKVNGGRN